MTIISEELIRLGRRLPTEERPVVQFPIAGTAMDDGRSCSSGRRCKSAEGERDRHGYLTAGMPHIPRARHLCALRISHEAQALQRTNTYRYCDRCAEAFTKKRHIPFIPVPESESA